MFSIGIGGDINIQELNSIATDPDTEHVFTVTNFASLKTISNSLTSRTCDGNVLGILIHEVKVCHCLLYVLIYYIKITILQTALY